MNRKCESCLYYHNQKNLDTGRYDKFFCGNLSMAVYLDKNNILWNDINLDNIPCGIFEPKENVLYYYAIINGFEEVQEEPVFLDSIEPVQEKLDF